jgi:hypothetical protein
MFSSLISSLDIYWFDSIPLSSLKYVQYLNICYSILQDEKPLYPQKIIKTEILYNPFPDIVPRTQFETREDKVEKSKKEKRAGVK